LLAINCISMPVPWRGPTPRRSGTLW
jgi:hypothetical protein